MMDRIYPKLNRGWPIALILICGLSGCTQAEQVETDKAVTNAVPSVSVAHVKSELVSYSTKLPGELLAFRNVGLYPRVAGFVKWMGVDRGSKVKQGEVIITLEAPELVAQKNQSTQTAGAAQMSEDEAMRQREAMKAQITEAKAKLDAQEITFNRMKEASIQYPGSVVQNEVDVAGKNVEAARANVNVLQEQEKAAEASIETARKKTLSAKDSAIVAKQMQEYLKISAPFDGVITERNVDEGSFVSPPTGTGTTSTPMLRVQQTSVLRLVVAVPETELAGLKPGTPVPFSVPAFPERTFTANVTRIGHALDAKTRTMPIELDVQNNGDLEPGMYPEVFWPVKRQQPSLVVPRTAVVTNTERRFVIRVKNDMTEWVDVKVGKPVGEMVEVFGDIATGDEIVVKGSDQIENGAKVKPELVSAATH